MKLLTHPVTKVVLICIATIVLWPHVRPYAQKIPVIGAYL